MKTIEERAKEYSLRDFDGFYTGREKAVEEGYIAGAMEQKYIDTEHLKSLWRDTTEEPKKEGWILIQFGAAYDTLLMPRDIDVWHDFVKIQYSAQWAYISDILQKGGER